MRSKIALFLSIFFTAAFFCFAQEPGRATGILNFSKVEDGFYRGGCPTQEGLKYLKQLGVKTIIDLRSGRCAVGSEKLKAEALGIRHINIPFRFFKLPPKDTDVRMFLQIAADIDSRPAFVHCQHGKDRTGAMVAVYRIAVCGWTAKKAYQEALGNGFNPFYFWVKGFIFRWEKKGF